MKNYSEIAKHVDRLDLHAVLLAADADTGTGARADDNDDEPRRIQHE